MKEKSFDVVVIGGGPSGMNAAKTASEMGAKTLLVERDKKLGGILNQCIHNGFGLKFFHEELTGPEFAFKMSKTLTSKNLTILKNTFATNIKTGSVTITNPDGVKKIKTKSIVLSSGCRERTAGGIGLVGNRPSGVWTAGFVQKMINHMGKLPGKTAVILGSGDIGLIMARRLTFEGVKVEHIFEIMKTSSGLQRNLKQCVEDFSIPMSFSTTITEIVGKEKVEGVYYAEVDENLNPIEKTKKFLPCDCVLLSVGLIPEIDLVKDEVETSKKTKGAIVDEYRQTSEKGLFSSGNCLHIHDLADNAAIEGAVAGKSAVLYAQGLLPETKLFEINPGENVTYCIPQKYHETENSDFTIFFRSGKKMKNVRAIVENENGEIFSRPIRGLNPGEMQEIMLKDKKLTGNLKVKIVEGETK